MADVTAVEDHRGTEVEEKLSRKHHQPKGVEQFGIEPIPEDLKTVKWYDLFVIIVNFLLNPGMILIGTLAVTAGLGFWAGVTTVVLGIVIAFGAYAAAATLGKVANPFEVVTEVASGGPASTCHPRPENLQSDRAPNMGFGPVGLFVRPRVQLRLRGEQVFRVAPASERARNTSCIGRRRQARMTW